MEVSRGLAQECTQALPPATRCHLSSVPRERWQTLLWLHLSPLFVISVAAVLCVWVEMPENGWWFGSSFMGYVFMNVVFLWTWSSIKMCIYNHFLCVLGKMSDVIALRSLCCFGALLAWVLSWPLWLKWLSRSRHTCTFHVHMMLVKQSVSCYNLPKLPIPNYFKRNEEKEQETGGKGKPTRGPDSHTTDDPLT